MSNNYKTFFFRSNQAVCLKCCKVYQEHFRLVHCKVRLGFFKLDFLNITLFKITQSFLKRLKRN